MKRNTAGTPRFDSSGVTDRLIKLADDDGTARGWALDETK